MSKRQHSDETQEAISLEPIAKRPVPLNVVESDESAILQLDALAKILGIDDLTQEDSTGALQSLPFVDKEKTSDFTDKQKVAFVEELTKTSSRLASLMAQLTRLQGTPLALRDLQVNWNLPEDRRWSELGAWKTISQHTNQTTSKVANEVKKLKRRQNQESVAPKGISTTTLLELFEKNKNSD